MLRTKPYYRKVLASYLLAVSLPVLVLSLLIFDIGVRQLREETQTGQVALMQQASSMISQRIREGSEMAVLLSMENDILALANAKNPYEIKVGIDRLRGYCLQNYFFSNIIIAQSEEDMYFTAEGTVSQHVFLKDRYTFSPEEASIFQSYIGDGRQHLVFFDQAGVIMLFNPYPLLGRMSTGCLIHVIERDTFTNLFAFGAADSGRAIVLLDADGRAIYSGDPQHIWTQPGLADSVREIENREHLAYHGEGYTVYREGVLDTDWEILLLISHNWLFQRMRMTTVALCVAGVLLVAGALIIWMSRRHYRPIGLLNSLAQYESKQTEACDELDNISAALHASMRLGEQIEQQRGYLRENLLRQMLYGDREVDAETRELLTAMNMFMREGIFCTVAMHLESDSDMHNHTAFLSHLERTYAAYDRGHALETDAREITLLLLQDAEHAEQVLPGILKDLQAALEKSRLRGYFGVSGLYPFERIPRSHLEARTALSYAKERGEPQVIHFDSIHTPPHLDLDFQKQEMLLRNSMTNGDAALAQEVLHGVIQTIQTRFTTHQLRNYYCYRLAETTVQLVINEKHVLQYVHEAEYRKLSSLLTEALASASFESYTQCMSDIVATVCALMDRVKSTRDEKLKQTAYEWVTRHITDPGLSLEMLADAMGYSPAYWSRFFREKLQLSFNECVWQMRCDLCKEQLKRTDLPIKQIVADIGYMDVSSFIRRFKHEVGITPGQYREMHGHKNLPK